MTLPNSPAGGADPSVRVEQLPVSSRERKIALCRAILGLRLKGEIEKALEFVTEDARFEIVGDDAFSPFSGASVGRRAIGQKIHMLHVAFEYTNIEPYLFVVEGDHVMARWRGRFRNRGTGPSAAIEGLAHATFRGDQICYFSIFYDTAAVARISAL
jgi:ketosteroid isomerase-like protein